MGKIVAVTIHKGGTGKTTVACQLAFLAAERGLRTLLVDLDAQGNATDTVLADDHPLPRSADDALEVLSASDLFEERPPKKPIAEARAGLHILPADDRLLAVERLEFSAAQAFRQRLLAHAQAFDLVVIDTPPTMGFAMLAPLLASDFAFAPIVPDPYSVKGIVSLIARVREIRTAHNPDLEFLGLIINKWRRNSSAANKVVAELRTELGDYLIPHALPESSAIADAAHRRTPVWHRPRSGSQRAAGRVIRDALSWVLERAAPAGAEARP